jgi:D-glycero-D-manno-heptose 1,7-bisphosphate phosphatase
MGIRTLMKKHKAVFLDRDGVLNHAMIKQGKPYPPSSLEELVIPDDALPALQMLKSLGYLLIGATNQPDVARGTTERSLVEAINARLLAVLPLDEIRVCYHDDHDACQCRKPLPGLMLQAAEEHGIELVDSIMIGDRWKDIEAGQRAQCKTIWLNRDYQESHPKQAPNYITTSLMQAAIWIKENQ